MATKQTTTSESVKNYLGASIFWNITDNVGYGYKNKESDVLLVQFFLNGITRVFNKYSGESRNLLDTDGKFGGKTWATIKWVQGEFLGVKDGMISPPDGSHLHTPKQGRVYTMYDLNKVYKNVYGHYFTDIRRDPDCPSKLISHFTV
jgi:hypothetical protein